MIPEATKVLTSSAGRMGVVVHAPSAPEYSYQKATNPPTAKTIANTVVQPFFILISVQIRTDYLYRQSDHLFSHLAEALLDAHRAVHRGVGKPSRRAFVRRLCKIATLRRAKPSRRLILIDRHLRPSHIIRTLNNLTLRW